MKFKLFRRKKAFLIEHHSKENAYFFNVRMVPGGATTPPAPPPCSYTTVPNHFLAFSSITWGLIRVCTWSDTSLPFQSKASQYCFRPVPQSTFPSSSQQMSTYLRIIYPHQFGTVMILKVLLDWKSFWKNQELRHDYRYWQLQLWGNFLMNCIYNWKFIFDTVQSHKQWGFLPTFIWAITIVKLAYPGLPYIQLYGATRSVLSGRSIGLICK